MRIGDLTTGRELTPEELTDWLIQRTRFTMGRKIPERSPEEFLKEEEKFRSSLDAYKSEERKLIDRMQKQLKIMQEQIDLRDQEIERLKKQLHNQYRILDNMETRVGEERQENNELRKRFIEISRTLGESEEIT